jgi:hypothetical protein
MGLIDKKRDIHTTIGAYVSLAENLTQPDNTDLFPSIDNSDDIMSYLLSLLSVTLGIEGVKGMVGEFFTDFIDDVEPTIKTALKKQLTQPNFSDNLPAWFLSGGTGVDIDVKDFDAFGKFKNSPSSDVGRLLYDDLTPNFDSKIYNAISAAGSDVEYNILNMRYDDVADAINFKSVGGAPSTIGDWLGSYVDDTVIINKKEFLSNVMNTVFGSMSSSQGKTQEQLFQELQIQKLLEKLADGEEDIQINQNEFDELLNKAQELVDGIAVNDLGCGLIETSLPLSGLTEYISSVSGLTDSNEAAEDTQRLLNQTFLDPRTDNGENRPTIEDSFFQRLLRIVQQMLIQLTVTSPQVRTLMGLISAFTNNGIAGISNPIDDIQDYITFIRCIIDELNSSIFEYIFNKIKAYLLDLIEPIIKEIIREKINQYLGQITSLVNLPI